MTEAIDTTQAILFLGIGILLVGLVTLFVCILTFRSTRRSVGLAEDRMQYLREEQERLAFLREEHRTLAEELKQERRERLDAQRKLDHLTRECEVLREAQREDPQHDRKEITEAYPRRLSWSPLRKLLSDTEAYFLESTETKDRGHGTHERPTNRQQEEGTETHQRKEEEGGVS